MSKKSKKDKSKAKAKKGYDKGKSGAEIMQKHTNDYLTRSTKGEIGKSLLKGLAYTGLAVGGGGIGAALIGKPSFYLGAGLTFLGFYKDNHWLSPLGLGMMASSHLVPTSELKGLEGLDFKQEGRNIKNRLVALKDSFLSKTYLDKVIPASKPKPPAIASEETTNGFGSVNANINALDEIEQQLVNQAIRTQSPQGRRSVNGLEAVEDYNF